jgi:hypothetical protein
MDNQPKPKWWQRIASLVCAVASNTLGSIWGMKIDQIGKNKPK